MNAPLPHAQDVADKVIRHGGWRHCPLPRASFVGHCWWSWGSVRTRTRTRTVTKPQLVVVSTAPCPRPLSLSPSPPLPHPAPPPWPRPGRCAAIAASSIASSRAAPGVQHTLWPLSVAGYPPLARPGPPRGLGSARPERALLLSLAPVARPPRPCDSTGKGKWSYRAPTSRVPTRCQLSTYHAHCISQARAGCQLGRCRRC
jgi:hypothetical protein